MTAQTSGSDPVRVGTLLGALAPLVIALVAGVAYVVNISRDLGDASQRITEVERLMDSGAAALWGPVARQIMSPDNRSGLRTLVAGDRGATSRSVRMVSGSAGSSREWSRPLEAA